MRRRGAKVLLAVLVVLLLMGASGTAPARSVTSGTLSAIRLSYDGQHLALIASDHNKPKLELATPSGGDLHTVTIPGGCAVNGIRWAPNWNRLAVATNCGADSSLWLLDVHSGNGPRELAQVVGSIRDVAWTGNGRRVAYLYSRDGTGNVVATVPMSGGAPKVVTPAGLDVHEFRYSLSWNLLLFTATPAADPETPDVPDLFVKNIGGDAPPVMVFNPHTAKGRLHGLYVTQPRMGRGGRPLLAFLGKTSKSNDGGNLYLVSGPTRNATPINLNEQFKPSWFTFEGAFSGAGTGTLAVQVVNGRTEVVKFFIDGTHARQTATLFTLPGRITDGRALSSISTTIRTAWNSGRQRLAFLQYASPDTQPVARVGWIGTEAPPEIRVANAK